MLKKIFYIFILTLALLPFGIARAAETLSQRLAGYILLQVETHGQAWYVNPADRRRHYLGRPADAFALMQKLGIGISNSDLEKIPLGLVAYDDRDTDADGLPDELENALATDPNNPDSDADGHDDKTEIMANYNPNGAGKLNLDSAFTDANLGKIFLQVENAGQAWYVNPRDKKRYFLSRPADAFALMRALSLGISNENLNRITVGYLNETAPTCSDCQSTGPDQIFAAAADAIRAGNLSATQSYFTAEMQSVVKYTLNSLSAEGRLILGNILSGSRLSSSTAGEKIYSNQVYFSLGGYEVPIDFHVRQQADGSWKLANL